jgi:hypothetical protein
MGRLGWLTLALAAAAFVTGCGGGTSTNAGGTSPASSSGAASSSGTQSNAHFESLNVCTLFTSAQVTALLGAPSTGAPAPGGNAGSSSTLRWCDYSEQALEVEIMTPAAYTPVQWAQQEAGDFGGTPEANLGTYAAYSAALGETAAAKGSLGVEISYPRGRPSTAPTSSTEALEASDIEAIWQKVGS